MKHIIYKVIDDFHLASKTNLESHLRAMSANDVNMLLDELDRWYENNRDELLLHTHKSNMFSIWLPRTRTQSLMDLSARSVIADKIIIDDTLYNYFSLYSIQKEEPDYFKKKMKGFGLLIGQEKFSEWGNEQIEKMLCRDISVLIDFYLRAKVLVDEDRFLPFIDAKAGMNPPDELEPLFRQIAFANPELNQVYYEIGQILEMPKHLRKTTFSTIQALAERGFEVEVELANLIGALSYSVIFSNLPAPGIDLLDEHTPILLNKLISLFQYAVRDAEDIVPLTPFSESTLIVPTLGNVPLSEVLEIKEKEKDAFYRFKAGLEARVAKISSEPGSDEWERDILAVRSDLKKDVVEIDAALASLKRDHLKRLSVEASTLTFSIALASFGVWGQAISPAATFQAVASGAGLVASLKSMASNFLAFYREKDSLQMKDTYFLWRLIKK
jgi:hypothetical protein